MKTRMRAIALWTGLSVFAILAALSVTGLAYYSMLTKNRKAFMPIDSKKVSDGLYVIKTGYFINCWLMRTAEGGYIAFDAGRDAGKIAEQCAALGIDPDSVVAVFLTHTDKEHTGGIRVFRKASVYLASAEVPVIDGRAHRYAWFAPDNKLDAPYSTLEDGQSLDVGGYSIRCVLNPGHTIGSMSYLVKGLLLTGDTLSVKDGTVALFNDFPFVNMDTNAMRKSISTLARLPGVERILTAHFGIIDDPKNAFIGW
jgi:hydroxyacylglutathione hydrolase